MKQILCLLLSIFLFLGFSACHVQESPKETQSTNSQIEQNIPPPSPMTIHSMDDLENLIKATKRSDSAVSEYVAQIRTKSAELSKAGKTPTINIPSNMKTNDIESFVQLIDSVGMPILKDGVKPESFHLTYLPNHLPDQSCIDIIYRVNGTQYRFQYHLSPWTMEKANEEPSMTWSISNDTVELYRIENYNVLVGELYRNNYIITVGLSSLIGDRASGSIDVQTFSPDEFVWSNVAGEVE